MILGICLRRVPSGTLDHGAGTDLKTGAGPGKRTLEGIFDQSAHFHNQLSLHVPPGRIHETSSYGGF